MAGLQFPTAIGFYHAGGLRQRLAGLMIKDDSVDFLAGDWIGLTIHAEHDVSLADRFDLAFEEIDRIFLPHDHQIAGCIGGDLLGPNRGSWIAGRENDTMCKAPVPWPYQSAAPD